MSINWIADQTLHGISQFDQAMINSYPDSNASLQNAHDYLRTVGHVCNYVAASQLVKWERYLPPNAKLLDIGCGGGWLAAMLSRLDTVQTVYALDSSRHFLYNLLPQVMELMQGNSEKLITIEGLFQPLLFEDDYLDMVVASSALHHADNLESVIRGIRPKLKRGGMLIVLNETPWPGLRHLLSVTAAALRIIKNLLLQRYHPVSPSISSSGYLYDPRLGDRDYPLWYWNKALESAGFSVESVIDTGMPTVANSKGRPLIHFICRAI